MTTLAHGYARLNQGSPLRAFVVRRIEPTFVATSVLLTTATQLRIPGVPLGPGEFMLAAWIVWRLLVLVLNSWQWRSGTGGHLLAIFWIVFLATAVLSWAIAYPTGRADEVGSVHDISALVFNAIFAFVLFEYLSSITRITDFSRILVLGTSVSVALLLVLALQRGTFAGIDPWFAGFRFTGWSKNPNQLGLLLVSMPFLLVWCARQHRRTRFAYVAAFFVVLIAGVICQSDALYVAWAAAGTGILTVWWVNAATRRNRPSFRSLLIVVAIPAALSTLALIFAATILAEIAQKLLFMYELGGQGNTRLQIWSNGMRAFVDSPFIGHGPGAFAGVNRPFENYEAHNTFIDISAKTGVIGLTAFLLLLIPTHFRLLAEKKYAILAAIAAITVFSFFHYVLRQPVFWMTIVIALRLAWPKSLDEFNSAASSTSHAPTVRA